MTERVTGLGAAAVRRPVQQRLSGKNRAVPGPVSFASPALDRICLGLFRRMLQCDVVINA